MSWLNVKVCESWGTKKLGACQLLTALFSWCSGACEGCDVCGVLHAMRTCASLDRNEGESHGASTHTWFQTSWFDPSTHTSAQSPVLLSLCVQVGGSLVKTHLLPLWVHRYAHIHRLLKHQHKFSGRVCTLSPLLSHWSTPQAFSFLSYLSANPDWSLLANYTCTHMDTGLCSLGKYKHIQVSSEADTQTLQHTPQCLKLLPFWLFSSPT